MSVCQLCPFIPLSQHSLCPGGTEPEGGCWFWKELDKVFDPPAAFLQMLDLQLPLWMGKTLNPACAPVSLPVPWGVSMGSEPLGLFGCLLGKGATVTPPACMAQPPDSVWRAGGWVRRPGDGCEPLHTHSRGRACTHLLAHTPPRGCLLSPLGLGSACPSTAGQRPIPDPQSEADRYVGRGSACFLRRVALGSGGWVSR